MRGGGQRTGRGGGRLHKHEKNGTGQVHKMNKWLVSKEGWGGVGGGGG